MELNMKNFQLLAYLSIAAGVFANSDFSHLEAEIQALKQGTSLKSALPHLKGDTGLYAEIGAIYQNASLGGMEFAWTNETGEQGDPFIGKLLENPRKMAWGVNAALGYRFEKQACDTKITNSYFNVSSSKSIATENGNVNPISISNDVCGAYVYSDSGKSNQKITYDLLGLEIGNNVFFNPSFSLRSMLGILTIWNQMTQKSYYNGIYSQMDNFWNTLDENKFFGIGPQVGLKSDWVLLDNFNLFLETKGALLYGSYKTKHKEYTNYYSYPDDLAVKLSISDKRIIPYVQALIGLSYEFYIADDAASFKIRAGYNTQYFFGANQAISTNSGDDAQQYMRFNNNLQTQGLLLDLSCSF